MQTKPNAQLWIMSTAGNARSVFLRDKVNMGRRRVDAGSTDLVAYFEWSFTEDEDPYDPATWWGRMPALGYTTGEREIAAAAASMDEREFLRAFGNRWLDDEDSASPIDRVRWLALVDDKSAPFGQVSVGIEVAQDRSWSSVMAVGPRGDGLLDCTLLANREGTSWVIDFVRSLLDPENRPVAVVIDPSSPAGSFVQELDKITDMPLVLVMARDMTQACGSLMDAVMSESPTLRHHGEPALNATISRARLRTSADAMRWDRRNSTDDISPLVALTLAWFGWSARGSAAYEPLDSFY
jgi:phage terminase large subunit-like protein